MNLLISLVTKVKKSIIDPSKKGLFLLQDVEAEQVVAFCTGTFWSQGDKNCNVIVCFLCNRMFSYVFLCYFMFSYVIICFLMFF
jgi:hypothetical protein